MDEPKPLPSVDEFMQGKELPSVDEFMGGDVSGLLNRMRGGIGEQESGNNYNVTPNARTSATGKFQVIPANIPRWTKKYYGRSLTPQEFQNDPKAQDAVFTGEMGKYLRKAKQKARDDDTAIRMAAAAWYGGEGAMHRYDDPTKFRRNEPSFREYTSSVLNRTKKGTGSALPDINNPVPELSPIENRVWKTAPKQELKNIDVDTWMSGQPQPVLNGVDPTQLFGGQARVAPNAVPDDFDRRNLAGLLGVNDTFGLEAIGEAAREGRAATMDEALPQFSDVQKRFDAERAKDPTLTPEKFQETLKAEAEAERAIQERTFLEQNKDYAEWLKIVGKSDSNESRQEFNTVMKAAEPVAQQQVAQYAAKVSGGSVGGERPTTRTQVNAPATKVQKKGASRGTRSTYVPFDQIPTDNIDAFLNAKSKELLQVETGLQSDIIDEFAKANKLRGDANYTPEDIANYRRQGFNDIRVSISDDVIGAALNFGKQREAERKAVEQLRQDAAEGKGSLLTPDWEATVSKAAGNLLQNPFAPFRIAREAVTEEDRQRVIDDAVTQKIKNAGGAQEAVQLAREYDAMGVGEKVLRHTGDFASSVLRAPAMFARTIAWAEDMTDYLQEKTGARITLTTTDILNGAGWLHSKMTGQEQTPVTSGTIPNIYADYIDKTFAQDPKTRDTLLGKIATAGGTSVPFLLGAMATGGSNLAVMMLGAGMEVGSQYKEAKDAGLSREKQLIAGLSGIPLGMSEALGLKWGKAGEALQSLSKGKFIKSFTKWAAETGSEFTEEALQEYFQSAAGKVVQEGLKNDGVTKETFAKAMGSSLNDALTGGIIGFIFGGGAPLVSHGVAKANERKAEGNLTAAVERIKQGVRDKVKAPAVSETQELTQADIGNAPNQVPVGRVKLKPEVKGSSVIDKTTEQSGQAPAPPAKVEADSVRVYRGAPSGELGKGDFGATFVSRNLEDAAQYGDVREYELKPQQILDIDDKKVKSLVEEFDRTTGGTDIDYDVDEPDNLFLFPDKKWVEFLKSKGYSATSIGNDLAIFNADDLTPTGNDTVRKVLTTEERQARFEKAEAQRKATRVATDASDNIEQRDKPKKPLTRIEPREGPDIDEVTFEEIPPAKSGAVAEASGDTRPVDPATMTLAEYTASDQFRQHITPSLREDAEVQELAKEIHAKAVETAINKGQTVAPEILADYPELSTKPTPAPQTRETQETVAVSPETSKISPQRQAALARREARRAKRGEKQNAVKAEPGTWLARTNAKLDTITPEQRAKVLDGWAPLEKLSDPQLKTIYREVEKLSEPPSIFARPERTTQSRAVNAEKQSLSQVVRAHGGIRVDNDRTNAGEHRRISNKETGSSGLINKNSKYNAEQMALAVWELGYLRSVWETAQDVNGNELMEFVEEDVAGDRKHYSMEAYNELGNELEKREIAAYEKELATLAEIVKDKDVAPILAVIEENGKATQSQRKRLERAFERYGIPITAVNPFIEDLTSKGTVSEARTPAETGEVPDTTSRQATVADKTETRDIAKSVPDILDTTERGIDYVKDVARRVESGELEIVRLDPEAERGRLKGGRRNVEASIVLAANERASEAAGSRTPPDKRQERVLEEYAKRAGIWLDVKQFTGEQQGYLGKGQEAYVHRSLDGKSVHKLVDYKAIDAHFTPLDFIDNRITLFNHLFPETPYELVGFTRDSSGTFRFVLKQPFVQDVEYTKPADRQAYMRGKGFEMTDRYGEEFATSLYHVSDLHEKNALKDGDGTIFVIDAVSRINPDVVQPFEITTATDIAKSVPSDDAVKEVRNDKGQLLAPNGKPSNLNELQWKQVRTPDFKKWGGENWENVVKDENGEPRVLWHHGPAGIEVFHSSEIGPHFGTQEQASRRALTRPVTNYLSGRTGKYYQAYLAIQNPFRVNDYTSFTTLKKGLPQKAQQARGWNDAKQLLREIGYDGLVYANRVEGGGDTFVPFEPTQIKSIGNRGTFDPNEANIMKRSADEIAAAQEDLKYARKILNNDLITMVGNISHEGDGIISIDDIPDYELTRRLVKEYEKKYTQAQGTSAYSGLTMDKATSDKFIGLAKEKRENAKKLDLDTAQLDAYIQTLEDARSSGRDIIFIWNDSAKSEELLQRAFSELRSGGRRQQVSTQALTELTSSDAFKKAMKGRFGRDYKGFQKSAQAEEFAAKALLGQYGDISAATEADQKAALREAVKWLLDYAETNKGTGTADDIIERIATEVAYAKETTEEIARQKSERDGGKVESESKDSSGPEADVGRESGRAPPIEPEIAEYKNRQHAQTLRDAGVGARDVPYIPETERGWMKKANEIVEKSLKEKGDYSDAIKEFNNPKNISGGERTALGYELINRLGSEGDYQTMRDIADGVVVHEGQAGAILRAAQLVSKYDFAKGVEVATKALNKKGKTLTDKELSKLRERTSRYAQTEEELATVTQMLIEAEAENKRLDGEIQEIENALNESQKQKTIDDKLITALRRQVSYWKNKKIATSRPKRTVVYKELDAKRDAILAKLRSAFGEDIAKMVAPEPQTETEAFKKWFGDSKVVDDSGNPLVVYHGTQESGIQKNIFDKTLLGSVTKSRSAKAGFFFVTDKDVARGYSRLANEKPVADLIARSEAAERKGQWDLAHDLIAQAEKLERDSNPQENVVSAYLSIQNPYEFDADSQRFLDIQDDIHDAITEARNNGHDGIVLRNLIDNADWGKSDATDHWIAFEPTQIKSATDNIGTFNPNNADISKSVPSEVEEDVRTALVDHTALQILEHVPYSEVITNLKEMTGLSDAEIGAIHADAVDAITVKSGGASPNVKVRNEHKKEARRFRDGGLDLNRLDREILKGVEDAKTVFATLLWNRALNPQDFRTQMQKEFPDMTKAEVDEILKDVGRRREAARSALKRAAMERKAERKLSDQEVRQLEVAQRTAQANTRRARQSLDAYFRNLGKGIAARVASGAMEVVNFTKGTAATGDVSYILRQGLLPLILDTRAAIKGNWEGVGHGLQSDNEVVAKIAKSLGYDNVAEYLAEHNATQFIEKVREHPKLQEAQAFGVRFTSIGDHNIADEHFSSRVLEAVPLYKRFELAYTLPGDLQRLYIYDAWANVIEGQNLTSQEETQAKKYAAKVVNAFTGKGDIGSVLAKGGALSKLANTAFFSPSLLVSRFQSLYYLTTGFATAPKGMRLQMAKKGFRAWAVMGLLAYLLGANLDPDDDEFGKIRPKKGSWLESLVGEDKSYNLFAGLDVPAQLFMRNGAGLLKAMQTGDSGYFTDALSETWQQFGTNKRNEPRFLRGKLSPSASWLVDYGTGTDYIGRPYTHWNAVTSRMTPLGWQQAYDALVYDRYEAMMKEPADVDRAKYRFNENERDIGNMLSVLLPTVLGISVNQYPRAEITPAVRKAAQIADYVSKKDSEVIRIEGGFRNLIKEKLDLQAQGKSTVEVDRTIRRFSEKYKTNLKKLESEARSETGLISFYVKDMTPAEINRVLPLANEAEKKVLDKMLKAKAKKAPVTARR